jgi:hypothetical protein
MTAESLGRREFSRQRVNKEQQMFDEVSSYIRLLPSKLARQNDQLADDLALADENNARVREFDPVSLSGRGDDSNKVCELYISVPQHSSRKPQPKMYLGVVIREGEDEERVLDARFDYDREQERIILHDYEGGELPQEEFDAIYEAIV